MNDSQIMQQISKMVDEEHVLLRQSETDGLSAEQHARMRELELSLDQCWDLLRQRRARREFGRDPDEARARPPSVVEHYQQ